MKENTQSSGDGLHPLFWDSIPEKAEDNPCYMGIQALMYDESTPIEQAENFKAQGNERLKVALRTKNKLYFTEAIKYYTKGISVPLESNPELRSILYSNRAQAQIYLMNWRKALTDCQAAVDLDPNNVKACYRGSRSSLQLDEIEVAVRMNQLGLSIEPSNKELLEIQKSINARLQIIEAEKARLDKKRISTEKQTNTLMEAFGKRSIRICQSNFKVSNLKPYVDESDTLHWPVLFVFPEVMQQDVIQDVSEADLISELLDVMFSPDAEPLVWDTENEYRRDNLDVYFLANAGIPFSETELKSVLMETYKGDPERHAPRMYGNKAAYFVKLNESQSIKSVLSTKDCIVPGVPTFFLVARGSNYHQKFLESISS